MKNKNMPKSSEFHVAMFPWFAMGHFIPFLRFSNKLAARGHRVSFLVPIKTLPKLEPINLFPNLISFVPLQVPHVDGLPLGTETMSDLPLALTHLLCTARDQMQDQIELILTNLKPHFIFYDFSYSIPASATRLGIKSVFFLVVSPTILAFLIPDHRVEIKGNHDDDQEEEEEEDLNQLLLPPPGYPSSSIFKLPRFLLHVVASHMYTGESFLQKILSSFWEIDAISFTTCQEIEGPFCDYIGNHYKKPVLLTGPVLPEPSSSNDAKLEENWANWLGSFKEGSVVYCAFGSQCKLEKNQFQELVLGLELTGLPFLAALKPPVGAETVEEALPEGFKERVGGRGVVHGGWVQQQLILEHPSVGCFVGHCGYGSMWESLASNCQIVLVPQIPDQVLNAQLMSRELKVAVEVERREEDGWYTSESVCKAVKLVMERESRVGNELKLNQAKWKSILLREGFESSYLDGFILNLKALMG